jgi:hypothetical protein
VIDAEDLRLVKRPADVRVQAPGARLVPAERLLDDQPGPWPLRADVQSGLAELDGDDAESRPISS